MQETYITDRFVLRPLRTSDAGLMALYMGDERVARTTEDVPHPLPPGTAEVMIANFTDPRRSGEVWAIDGSHQGHAELVGMVSLAVSEDITDEIGYWVAPHFWNHGIATEAVSAIVAKNPRNAAAIVAQVFQDSPASARVLTKVGFDYVGDGYAFSVARGATLSTWRYRLTLADRRAA